MRVRMNDLDDNGDDGVVDSGGKMGCRIHVSSNELDGSDNETPTSQGSVG